MRDDDFLASLGSDVSIRVSDETWSLLNKVYTPNGQVIWLRSKQRQFDNYSALELIALGEEAAVQQALHMLIDGAFA